MFSWQNIQNVDRHGSQGDLHVGQWQVIRNIDQKIVLDITISLPVKSIVIAKMLTQYKLGLLDSRQLGGKLKNK